MVIFHSYVSLPEGTILSGVFAATRSLKKISHEWPIKFKS
jgi:hypothetical protein